MGFFLPVIMFVVTEVLLGFSFLLIIIIGYTLPVQRFQLHQLRLAVETDANILAEALAERIGDCESLLSPSSPEVAANSGSKRSDDAEDMRSWPYGRGVYLPATGADAVLGSDDQELSVFSRAEAPVEPLAATTEEAPHGREVAESARPPGRVTLRERIGGPAPGSPVVGDLAPHRHIRCCPRP